MGVIRGVLASVNLPIKVCMPLNDARNPLTIPTIARIVRFARAFDRRSQGMGEAKGHLLQAATADQGKIFRALEIDTARRTGFGKDWGKCRERENKCDLGASGSVVRIGNITSHLTPLPPPAGFLAHDDDDDAIYTYFTLP